MLISCAWLREWVATELDARALAQRLTLGGLEVEAIARAAPKLDANVVVGKIVDCRPHPNAPRLSECWVEVGHAHELSGSLCIVCGADNATVGVKAPVALHGAKLPGLEVREKMIRGVTSQGMLCSAAELGLAEQSDGIMLLDANAAVGAEVRDHLHLDDDILELAPTPNRGDCLSVLGVAREVSALTGAKMRAPIRNWRIRQQTVAVGARGQVKARDETEFPIELRAPQACSRYVGRAVFGIDPTAPTPDWMAERLRRGGLRGIGIVVDITNYVMLELGQPLHAFDFDRLDGGIVVRLAHDNEQLKLLDGNTVTLRGRHHLVIADRNKAVALGGIMGGADSAISAATRNAYLEAAFFPAAAMRGKARALGMQTDAAHRFERGADPALQAAAIERATQLLVQYAGGEVNPGPITDVQNAKHLPKPVQIQFDRNEIQRILSPKAPVAGVSTLLTKLGMGVERNDINGVGWNVTAPSWRFDLSGAHDLVEEVGRIHGFDAIDPRVPSAMAVQGRHPEQRVELAQIKRRLIERGYFEAITYSFVDPETQRILTGAKGIRLCNPIADNLAAMRRSLWPGLLEAVKRNVNRQHERVRLFETGNVFRAKGRGGGKHEEAHCLAAAVVGPAWPRQWGESTREADFFDLKGDALALLALCVDKSDIAFRPVKNHSALHPGRAARIYVGKKDIGYLGQLHPSHQDRLGLAHAVYLLEFDLKSVLTRGALPRFSAISRYPTVRRDLSVVVDAAVGAREVMEAAHSAARDVAGELLTDLALFDIYEGKQMRHNEMGFAFRLTFQSQSRNLTSDEVDECIHQITDKLASEFGVKLRSTILS